MSTTNHQPIRRHSTCTPSVLARSAGLFRIPKTMCTMAKGSFVNNLNFLLAGLGALPRCESLVWRATPRSSRLASHPNPTAKSPSYFLTSPKGSFVNNLNFLLAGLGALPRCESLVWRATPRSSRLASHPNPTAKSPSYFLTSPKLNSISHSHTSSGVLNDRNGSNVKHRVAGARLSQQRRIQLRSGALAAPGYALMLIEIKFSDDLRVSHVGQHPAHGRALHPTVLH